MFEWRLWVQIDIPNYDRKLTFLSMLTSASGFRGGRFECTLFDVWVLILMLPLTNTPVVTESTSWRRIVTMNREWERLNTLPLLLLFWQQLVVWPMEQQCSTRCLPPAWPPNGINPIAQQCPGFDADLLFPFFDQLFSVLGVLAPAVDMRPNFGLHQWTWSYLNLILFSFFLLKIC